MKLAAVTTARSYPVPPDQIQTARQLHALLETVPLENRYSYLAEHFGFLSDARTTKFQDRGRSVAVHGPWDTAERILAKQHIEVLRGAYGPNGHYAIRQGEAGLAEELRNGALMVWNLIERGERGEEALATSALALHHPGFAEMCRSAAIQTGVGSPVQFRRLAQFFERAAQQQAYRVIGLESELWSRGAYTDAQGNTFPTSVQTQHLNVFLAPMLTYSLVGFRNGASWLAEPQFDGRFYIQPEAVLAGGAIFTPSVNPLLSGGMTMADVVAAAYGDAFGTIPAIIDSSVGAIAPTELEDIHYVMGRIVVKISGKYTDAQLKALIENEAQRNQTGVLEFAVVNHPGNIRLQEQLFKLGFVPAGALPGGRFTIQGYVTEQPTLLHYQKARPGLQMEVVPVELAKDYQGTEVGKIALRQEAYWKEVHGG